MDTIRLSDNYELAALGKTLDGVLIETIEGKNLQGEPTTAYVYRPDSEEIKEWWADGNEVIGVDDSEEPTVLVQFIVPNPEGPKGEMPLAFGPFGLASLRESLAR